MKPEADGALLKRVVETKDFVQSVLNDCLDDWNLAKEFGEFLVRIEPEDTMGYALLARAHRHLGQQELAVEALRHVQNRIRRPDVQPSDAELFLPLLTEEEKFHAGEAAE